MKYRIIPFGETSWAIEASIHSGPWVPVEEYKNNLGFIRRLFEDESAAEQWIDEQVLKEQREQISKQTVEERRRKNPPREYP